MNKIDFHLLSFDELSDYLLFINFALMLVLCCIFVLLIINFKRVMFLTEQRQNFAHSFDEYTTIVEEKVSLISSTMTEYKEFQEKFQISNHETFQNSVFKKFNELDVRLDELHHEVVTQQMARHRLNEIIAEKLKVDPE